MWIYYFVHTLFSVSANSNCPNSDFEITYLRFLRNAKNTKFVENKLYFGLQPWKLHSTARPLCIIESLFIVQNKTKYKIKIDTISYLYWQAIIFSYFNKWPLNKFWVSKHTINRIFNFLFEICRSKIEWMTNFKCSSFYSKISLYFYQCG